MMSIARRSSVNESIVSEAQTRLEEHDTCDRLTGGNYGPTFGDEHVRAGSRHDIPHE
jgi:hypothetical protein